MGTKESTAARNKAGRCIFPFIFDDTTYNGCTHQDNDSRGPWCATAVGSKGSGKLKLKAYGYCTEGCPTHKP